MRWRALLLCLSMTAASLPADAQNARAMRDMLEARMLVTGTVDIEPDGSVSAIALDRLEELPDPVVDLVERAAARWRFEPILVDGAAVPARTTMSLKVLANKVQGSRDEFAVRLADAYFGQVEYEGPTTAVRMQPPPFPAALSRIGVSGTVYLVLKIGRDGRVADAMVEQVNLKVVGDARRMQSWRRTLSGSALAAARQWTFAGPEKGDEADASFRSVRVPVDYRFEDEPHPQAGKWEAYIPGPRQAVPWLTDAESSTQPDTLAAGGVHPVSPGRRLLTALDPGT